MMCVIVHGHACTHAALKQKRISVIVQVMKKFLAQNRVIRPDTKRIETSLYSPMQCTYIPTIILEIFAVVNNSRSNETAKIKHAKN